MVKVLMLKQGGKAADTNRRRLLLIALGLLLIAILSKSSLRSDSSSRSKSEEEKVETDSARESMPQIGKVEQGSTGGVAYYHCGARSEKVADIVMLHGARFTKEDWKTSGILDQLCSLSAFGVTALDLRNGAGAAGLRNVLEAMKQDGMVETPVTVVTPSASGKTIVDWVVGGEVADLKSFVNAWVPIAPPAVQSLDESSLRALTDLPILAIYGDQDSMGKDVSETLGKFATAKVVELDGRHPCYLDSPDAFVETLKKFLLDLH